MRNLVALALMPLAACTSVQPALSAEACSPASLARFTGQPATSDLAAQMLAATGKTIIRWVKPGMMVTMDFREDRLTAYLDAVGRVERATCG